MLVLRNTFCNENKEHNESRKLLFFSYIHRYRKYTYIFNHKSEDGCEGEEL